MKSTSHALSGENAPGLPKHLQEPFDEQKKACQDFNALLESLLLDSSPGSLGVPVSSSSPADSQST